MRAIVLLKMAQLLKFLITFLKSTAEWRLVRMHTLVLLQVVRSLEALRTHLALERLLLAGVRAVVHLHLAFRLEALLEGRERTK